MIIAVCEDTVSDMERIMDLCDAYAQARGYRIDLLTYASGKQLLSDGQAQQADIMVLDIMMPSPDGEGSYAAGIQIARIVRAQGYRGPIVFTTSSRDYYPEGFEVGAAHYLIKPLTYAALEDALDRAMRVVTQPERVISVPVNRVQVDIAVSAIQYAEVYGRETQLYTVGDTVRVLLPLKRIEEMLAGEPFLRCYRSYIINMDYVQTMAEDHFVLRGDVQIPISLRNRQALREKFYAYRLSKVH